MFIYLFLDDELTDEEYDNEFQTNDAKPWFGRRRRSSSRRRRWFRSVVRKVGRVTRRVIRAVRRVAEHCLTKCSAFTACVAKSKGMGYIVCRHLKKGCRC